MNWGRVYKPVEESGAFKKRQLNRAMVECMKCHKTVAYRETQGTDVIRFCAPCFEKAVAAFGLWLVTEARGSHAKDSFC